MNNTKLHPEKWHNEPQEIPSAQLASDESLAMAMMYTIQKNGTDLDHVIFAVTRKDNKVISNLIICHQEADGRYCPGHRMAAAEYDASEEFEMIKETREEGLNTAARIAIAERPELFIDTKKPIFYMEAGTAHTREDLIKHMAKDNHPEGIKPKQVIKHVLGLSNNTQQEAPTLEALPQGTEASTAPVTLSQTENTSTTNLKRAAEEAELIKKFGKAKMNRLAKKINYKGAIINKVKSNV